MTPFTYVKAGLAGMVTGLALSTPVHPAMDTRMSPTGVEDRVSRADCRVDPGLQAAGRPPAPATLGERLPTPLGPGC